MNTKHKLILIAVSLLISVTACSKKEPESKNPFNTASGMPNQTNLPGETDEEIYKRLHKDDKK